MKKYDIELDYSRDKLFSESGLSRMKDGYMLETEESPQERFAFVSKKFSSNPEHAQRLYDYSSKMWLSYATPILSYNDKERSLPISCFGSYLGDTLESIIHTSTETRMLTVVGGGVGLHVGLRPGDRKSTGVLPHLKTYDVDMLAYKQGTCYHPDVEIMTSKGWLSFKDIFALSYSDRKALTVLQISTSGQADFIHPSEWVEQDYSGDLIRFVDSFDEYIDIMVTPNHRMIYKLLSTQYHVIPAGDLSLSKYTILSSAIEKQGTKKDFTDYDRLYIAFNMCGGKISELDINGKKTEYSTLELTSYHQIDELDILLQKNGISPYYVETTSKGSRIYYFAEIYNKIFKKSHGIPAINIDASWGKAFMKDILFWLNVSNSIDGSDPDNRLGPLTMVFDMVIDSKTFADEIQYIAALSGVKTRIMPMNNESWIVECDLNDNAYDFSTEDIDKLYQSYTGKVYCAIVPYGGLMVRSNGHTLVCGNTRRGATAAYLDIDHPDIIEFLEMRKPTGGDPNRKCLNIHHGVNLTDEFMQRIEQLSIKGNALTQQEKEELDKWALINPHTKEVVEYVSVRNLWERILMLRMETGEPYMWFIDTVNKAMPEYQKKLGLENHGSNLCLSGDTLIDIKEHSRGQLGTPITATSSVTLEDFVQNFKHYSEVYVKSYDTTTKRLVWSKVTAVYDKGATRDVYAITTPLQRRFRCTPDHAIFTHNRGFVLAKDLQDTDVLLEVDNANNILPPTKGTLDIKLVFYKNPIKLYDITVKDTACFFANDVLVHNCSEISLATNNERTFVCCLSSVNLERYDEWKDNKDFIPDVVEMLDNVLETFITKGTTIPHVERAIESAKRERAIGIGALGWHSLLMKKNIPFESALAVSLNKRIWSSINEQAKEKTKQLAVERGSCLDAEPNIDIELEDGSFMQLKGNDFVKVIRNDQEIVIRAFQLSENDDLIEVTP